MRFQKTRFRGSATTNPLREVLLAREREIWLVSSTEGHRSQSHEANFFHDHTVYLDVDTGTIWMPLYEVSTCNDVAYYQSSLCLSLIGMTSQLPSGRKFCASTLSAPNSRIRTIGNKPRPNTGGWSRLDDPFLVMDGMDTSTILMRWSISL